MKAESWPVTEPDRRAGRVKAERVFADRAHRRIVAEQWSVAASDGKILLVQA
jgi:hypothetical protein